MRNEMEWWEKPNEEDKYDLPVDYDKLEWWEKKKVREQYMIEQENVCWYCKERLDQDAPKRITEKPINWGLFPPNFLKHPIHLQHDHYNGMTEGAVHSYCNAVLWQYEGK
jgi:hypothetical protein